MHSLLTLHPFMSHRSVQKTRLFHKCAVRERTAQLCKKRNKSLPFHPFQGENLLSKPFRLCLANFCVSDGAEHDTRHNPSWGPGCQTHPCADSSNVNGSPPNNDPVSFQVPGKPIPGPTSFCMGLRPLGMYGLPFIWLFLVWKFRHIGLNSARFAELRNIERGPRPTLNSSMFWRKPSAPPSVCSWSQPFE